MVTVRGGGHNVAGTTLCDGGGDRPSAMGLPRWIQRLGGYAGGATLADLDHATVPFAGWPLPGSSPPPVSAG